MTNIGIGIFDGCSSLTSINIPSKVTNIGNYAFRGCSNVTSIKIPEGVTSLNDWTFEKCSSLTDITIPDSVTTIGKEVFYQCSNLKSVTIPKSVTSMGEEVFLEAPDVVIYCEPGSVAEVYAKENKVSFRDKSSVTNDNQSEMQPTGNTPPTVDTSTASTGGTSTSNVTTPMVDATQSSETSTPSSDAITVSPVMAQKITLNKISQNMYVGEKFTVTATILPGDAASKAVTYKSSKPSIATVDAKGKVTAKKRGTTVITVTAKDGSGVVAKCTIRVGYRIVYKLNGGKNNAKNPSAYASYANVKLALPSKSGYIFKGWYTTKDFQSKSKVTTISKKTKGVVTVHAKWEKVKKPAQATLKTVKSSKSGTLTVTAKKSSSVTGYQFLVATDKNFKKNVMTITTKKLTTTFKGLKKGKIYYVKVRAYRVDSANKKIYGAYSSVKTVKGKK